MSALHPLPATFAATREGLHALAEHVIAPLRYLEEGHIGLRATPLGFGTEMLPNDRQVRVANGVLVDWTLEHERREEITTLGEAAAFLDVEVGAPVKVYTPATDGDPKRPLGVDVGAATVLGEWYTFGATVLQQVRAHATVEDAPTIAQLWPEHFDLALDLGPDGHRANVGASPGDAQHPEPYLYVGPWADIPSGGTWNEPFGASLAYADLVAAADPVATAVAWVGERLAAVR